jgi:uncharacterized RDD family membrane protein YckC
MITPLTEYASFFQRLVATLIDALWLGLLIILSLYLLFGNETFATANDFSFASSSFSLEDFQWQTLLIKDLLPALLTLFFWLKYAATPGKLMLDCEIVNAKDGKPITFQQALLRYLGYFVSTLVFGLGFLWVLWDKRKQGWHDKIAGTVVIIHDDATLPLHQLDKNYH